MILPAPVRFLQWLPPMVLAVGSLLACGWLSLQPVPGSGVRALLFPPWWSATRSFLAAAPAGQVIRFGLFPDIVIIAPVPGAEPLRATGAWAVLDPRRLGGCAPFSARDIRDE